MKNLKELKEYITRLAHEKRMLDEAMEYLTTLDKLENIEKELQKNTKKAQKEYEDAQVAAANAKLGVKAIMDEAVNAKAEVANILKTAREKAEKIISEAHTEAHEIKLQANQQVTHLDVEIDRLKGAKSKLEKEVAELGKVKEKADKELTGLRKKLFS